MLEAHRPLMSRVQAIPFGLGLRRQVLQGLQRRAMRDRNVRMGLQQAAIAFQKHLLDGSSLADCVL